MIKFSIGATFTSSKQLVNFIHIIWSFGLAPAVNEKWQIKDEHECKNLSKHENS